MRSAVQSCDPLRNLRHLRFSRVLFSYLSRPFFMACMAAWRGLQTGTTRRDRAQEDQALPLHGSLHLVTMASSPPGLVPDNFTPFCSLLYTTEGKFLPVTHRIKVRGKTLCSAVTYFCCKCIPSYVFSRDGATLIFVIVWFIKSYKIRCGLVVKKSLEIHA